MENLGIDENTRNTGGGSIYGTDMTLPIFVNPSTGELLIEIIPTSTAGTSINPRNINIDENNRNIGGAITDDSDENIIPLTTIDRVDLPCLRIEL